MLPNMNYMPVEELVWMKRGELMREFEELRLERVARISNPLHLTPAGQRRGAIAGTVHHTAAGAARCRCPVRSVARRSLL